MFEMLFVLGLLSGLHNAMFRMTPHSYICQRPSRWRPKYWKIYKRIYGTFNKLIWYTTN